MIAGDTDYGIFGELVSTSGSLIATVGAVALGWRRRSKWEPSEEDIAKGPQRVGSLLASVVIALLWVEMRDGSKLPILTWVAITAGVLTLCSLCVYGFLVSVFTYDKEEVTGNQTITKKVIGGLLTSHARQVKRAKLQAGEIVTTQQLFKGAAYDPDLVWSRVSRAVTKLLFVLGYLGLTISGTVALATVSIIIGISQRPQ